MFAPRWRRALGNLVPRSLGLRLALTYTGLVLLIMAGLGWTVASTIRDFSLAQLRGDLLEETQVVADLMAPAFASGGDPATIGAIADNVSAALGARVTVVAANGTVLADSQGDAATMDDHAGRPEILEAFRTGTGSSLRTSATMDQPYMYVARSIADGQAVLRLALPLDRVDALLRDVQVRVAAAALVAATLMTGAGWFVARRIGEGLADLRRQAAAVAAGRLDVSVAPAATRELGDVGRTFNAMTGQLRATLTELERVRARLEATLANLSDGVVITDDQGHVALVNDAARRMLAVRGALLGEPFVAVGRDHELAIMVREALVNESGSAERVVQHGISGRFLQAAATRLEAAEERIALVVLRDVSELRRLERMRRDFVANVSHELRTPLASIRALAETLEAGAVDEPDVAATFMRRIVSEVDRLAQLVDELLDLARLETGREPLVLERVAPADLIERAMRRMAPQIERANLIATSETAGGTPAVVADRGRIEQVLLNLIHNAVKFTPSGGSIALAAAPAGDAVEFRVRDTGVGVDPHDLPRLFERFYKVDRSRESQGTGLGLAIAKHIVQGHGGSIRAELNPDRGTTFVFTLPIAGPARPETANAIEQAAGEMRDGAD